jgi:8-oxo-dGTP diphosphatase
MKDCDRIRKTPYLTVDAVIIKNSKILLVKRKKEAFIGYWALPGGFVNVGERAIDAAVREAMEETGLKVKAEKTIGVYDDPKRDPRFHTASVAFLCRIKGGNLKPHLEEVSETKFFSIPEIRKLKIAFDHRKIIKDALKMRGRKS